jgi:hypothetical protein
MSLFFALLIVLATCDNAFAYTDPGTGLLIWQMLCAVIIGGLFYLKKIISYIKSKLHRKND